MKETLTLVCRVRFCPSQWAQIEERARRRAMRPSTYVRTKALRSVPRQRRRAKETDVVYHLGQIGDHLNQLAHRYNSGLPVGRMEVLDVLSELRGALRRI